jgi:hypothetical protein
MIPARLLPMLLPALFRGVGEAVEVVYAPPAFTIARRNVGTLDIERLHVGTLDIARKHVGTLEVER